MNAIEEIRADIPDFPGCEGEEECRLSDEQVRSYVGERLAALPVDQFSEADKSLYEKVLFRCEFMNQEAFRIFDEDRNEDRINAVLAVPGQAMRKNEPVLVIEAMKMEIQICPAVDGVLKTIQVKAGEAVSTGQLLFELT